LIPSEHVTESRLRPASSYPTSYETVDRSERRGILEERRHQPEVAEVVAAMKRVAKTLGKIMLGLELAESLDSEDSLGLDIFLCSCRRRRTERT